MGQRLDLLAEGKTVPLWRLEVAGSWISRLRGLIGRHGLAADEGLYLPGTNGVHMFFMRFAIDVVFIGALTEDGACRVVALKQNLRPWTGFVPWVRGAHGAVELTAGAIARAGIRPGDTVSLRDPAEPTR